MGAYTLKVLLSARYLRKVYYGFPPVVLEAGDFCLYMTELWRRGGHILCFVIVSKNPCLCFRISGAAVSLSPASVCRRGTILHVRLPAGRPVLLKALFLFSFFLLRNGLPSLGTGCNTYSLPPSAKRSFRIHKKGSDRCSSLKTHAPHIYPL